MTATSTSPRSGAQARRQARSADTVRSTVVAISALVAVVGGFLGSAAVVGTPIDQAAGGALSASSTLVAPGGPAFSIWSVVYAGLVVLAAHQLLPRQRSDARQRAGEPAALRSRGHAGRSRAPVVRSWSTPLAARHHGGPPCS